MKFESSGCSAPIAQRKERWSTEPKVVGSNPTGRTMDIPICPECKDKPIMSDGSDYLCRWCRLAKDGKLYNGGKVHSVQVEHYDESYAPAERILDLARVGDVLFFDLLEYEETTYERRAKVRAHSGYTIEALDRAFRALGLKIVEDK